MKMCKHCKLEKKIKLLEAEIESLKSIVNSHVGHYITQYPFSYTYTYPYTSYTITGNGGASSEG